MTKKETIPELLQRINNGDTLELLRGYITNESIKFIFGYGFIPKGKWLLPDGTPPYKEDSAPEGMTPGNLWIESKKFQYFANNQVQTMRREQLFIQLLESVHPTEARLVIAIKEQAISTLYPNITLDKIVDAGFFIWPAGINEAEYRANILNPEVKKVEPPKSQMELFPLESGLKKSRGRPRKVAG